MTDKTCKTCEWWDLVRPGQQKGDCLWLPPTVVYKAERLFHDGISERHEPEGGRTVRPETHADDRCGQWRKREVME